MLAISIPVTIYGDKIPRRASVLIGGTLLGSCMFIIGLLYATDSVHATGPARWVVIILVFIFGLSYCATWGVVGKIYASEIQPPATRSSANSVASGLGFFTNWLVAITTPIFLAQSRFGAYFLFAGFCIFTVLVLAAYMPETKGLSLEAIQEAFRQPVTGGSRVTSYLRRWTFGRRAAATPVSSGAELPTSDNGSSDNEQGRESYEMSGGILQGVGILPDAASNTSALESGARVVRMEAA